MRARPAAAVVLALALGLAACDGDMDAYFARDVVETDADIGYVDGSDDPRQRLDLYRPRAVRNWPVVVFVHGGYWVAQDKRYFSPIVGLYGNVGRALARRGIGVVIPSYRLVPGVTFDGELSDVLAAVRWTIAHVAEHGGDPGRIVLAGHSAGGHMTALAAFDPSRMTRAGIDPKAIRGYAPLSPIFDLEDMAAHPPEDGFDDRVVKPVFGDRPDRLRTESPRTYFSRAIAPMFVAMGDRDEPYLVDQIPRAVGELQRIGAPVTLLTLPDHSHADVVVRFDGGDDQLAAPLAEFVQRVTR